MTTFPFECAYRLPTRPAEHQWLIEDLWSDGAVGIVGGEPKCCKSFLALDMAVSVASGTPCLRRYSVARRGRVLLYAAEDALHDVRVRLEGIAQAAGVAFDTLDVQVITAPSMRLDKEEDRARLSETIASLKPSLLILDPFVRLHRVDENVSSEVAPLLAYLRELQRRHNLSVVVVHHAKKGPAKARAGQALRGSSEFHAWGDSNLYLRRSGDSLRLSVEHRAAPSVGGIPVALMGTPGAVALGIAEEPPPEPASAEASAETARERILAVLRDAGKTVSLTALRKLCRMRTQRLAEGLQALVDEGCVEKTQAGYRLPT